MTKSDLFPSVMIRTIIQNAIHCEFWRRARFGQGNTAHFMNVSTFEHVIAKHRRRIVTFSVKLYSVDVNENDYFSVCLNIIRSRTYVRSACFTLQKLQDRCVMRQPPPILKSTMPTTLFPVYQVHICFNSIEFYNNSFPF